jgi:flagellar biosynthetic protein FliR
MELLIGKFLVFILIFIRVFAMFSVGPLFGSASVPVPARLFLSLTTAYIMLLIVPDMPIAYDSAFGILALLGVKEAITGMIMGFSLNFVFYGVSYAAYQMGIDMGLNMATLFDPATEVENNVLGQIFNWAAILLFLTLNGHHYFIRGLAVSFKIIPLGHYTINESVYTLLLRGSAGIFITAVKIAAPVMVAFCTPRLALFPALSRKCRSSSSCSPFSLCSDSHSLLPVCRCLFILFAFCLNRWRIISMT